MFRNHHPTSSSSLPVLERLPAPLRVLLLSSLACTPSDPDEGPDTAAGDTTTASSTTADPTTGADESSESTTTGGGGVTTGGNTDDGETGADDTSTGDTGELPVCPLPDQFSWTSSGPLAEPSSPPGHDFRSLKDFTVVRWEDQYIVYATAFDASSSWTGVHMTFDDWPDMATAPQTWLGPLTLGATVAPQLMYFEPDDVWVLSYQWGFKYATSTEPNDPDSWTTPSPLLIGDPTQGSGGTGPIDQTIICDDTDCYIFFAGDNGHIYRGSMPIGDFPGAFSNTESIMSEGQFDLFEGVEVYAVRGSDQYLMIVEAIGGGGRYFRAFTSNDLGGDFTAMPMASSEATPFAGGNNVTFMGNEWTDDISHGDLVRVDPSQRKEIDTCNLQFLYQGRDPSVNGDYGLLPYRPGVLTLTN